MSPLSMGRNRGPDSTCQDFVYNADRDHWFLRKPIMEMNHSASSTTLQ